METLKDTMRPKVNGDTIFIPDHQRGVYFRNNSSSFRMGGKSIDQWIEKLIPMFNGKHTLGDLTKGLPDPYRKQIYEITEVLHRNGFIRDVSQDRPHQLSQSVLDKYASQIEFLDNCVGSGPYRFQMYRKERVLAIGSGPFFVSLLSALCTSGKTTFHYHRTDTVSTDRTRILELINHSEKKDEHVAIEEVKPEREDHLGWKEMLQQYDSVLYVCEKGDIEELQWLNALCHEEKKRFLPAVFVDGVGIVGPLVVGGEEACWESAWRSLHSSVFDNDPTVHTYSSTAAAMLANVIVFEWFKHVTGVTEHDAMNRIFLLNVETLEGKWHPLEPHPLVGERVVVDEVRNPVHQLGKRGGHREEEALFRSFGKMTSEVTGIFHTWEEEDQTQLPLSQCMVQVVDPRSEGPSELLPKRICSGLTHTEARREAGLTGLEMYGERLFDGDQSEPFIHGIGAGESFAEAVHRGLVKCLVEVQKKQNDRKVAIDPIPIDTIEDDVCTFYIKSLTKMNGETQVAIGEHIEGCPTAWVQSGDEWYGSADIHVTSALRHALQAALMKAQNGKEGMDETTFSCKKLVINQSNPQNKGIEKCDERALSRRLIDAIEQLGERVAIHEWKTAPFHQENINLVAVCLREEGAR